jgi:hypothetical protein
MCQQVDEVGESKSTHCSTMAETAQGPFRIASRGPALQEEIVPEALRSAPLSQRALKGLGHQRRPRAEDHLRMVVVVEIRHSRLGCETEHAFAGFAHRVGPVVVLSLVQPVGMHTTVVRGVEELQIRIAVQADRCGVGLADLDNVPVLGQGGSARPCLDIPTRCGVYWPCGESCRRPAPPYDPNDFLQGAGTGGPLGEG